MSTEKGQKPTVEAKLSSFIIVKTPTTSPARMMEGTYTGYISTLRADPSNTGAIYVGKTAISCTFPFAKNDVQVTRADLDKLFYYSSNGTDKLHIWGDREK